MSLSACLLPNRGVLKISGPDRASFLQGLISNDINLCHGDAMLYAALLTPQGKFLHDMFIVEHDDSYLIDCEAGVRAEDLLKRLTAYKLRAKVALENVSDQFDVWANWGDAIKDFILDPRALGLGTRAFIKKGTVTTNKSAAFAAYDQHRLSLGIPDGNRDLIVEKSTLSDGNLDVLNAVSWTKGCYIGQELTARMHHRALVKKRMFPVRIEGEPPAPGSIITLDDQDIGEMRSSCGNIGLVLVSVEKAEATIHGNKVLASGKTVLRITSTAYKI